MLKNTKDFTIFRIDFQEIINSTQGNIILTNDGLEIDFNNDFGGFTIENEAFWNINDEDIDAHDLKIGDVICICDNLCKITDMDTETHEENIEFWERVETEEWLE